MSDLILGDLIRSYRVRNGYTQFQLSNKLKISQAYLSLIEKGERPAGPALLLSMRKIFKLNDNKLIDQSQTDKIMVKELIRKIKSLTPAGIKQVDSYVNFYKNTRGE